MADSNQALLNMFADLEAVTGYAEEPPRYVPGFEALHRMTRSYSPSVRRPMPRYSCLGRVAGWSSRRSRRPNPTGI